MEYLLLAGVILAAALIYSVRCMIEDKRRLRRFEQKLRTEYGKREGKRYPPERLQALKRHFARGREGAFFPDETTCNDLEFDSLFARIDRTFSAAGEEALYSMLRVPCFDKDELKRRRELTAYFMEHEDERVRLQLFYAGIGRTDRYSVYDYLDSVMELSPKSNAGHYLMIVLMLLALLSMFLNPSVGLFCFITLFLVNFLLYFKLKAGIEPYIATFGYILRILHGARSLEECGIRELSDILSDISADIKDFRGFERFAFFLTGEKVMSSDPLDILMDYLRMGLHLNIIKFNSMLRQLQEKEAALEDLLYKTGYIEAMISAGEFAASLPTCCYDAGLEEDSSEKNAGKVYLKATGLYHPLLSDPVSNDVELSGSMLLTGSNASGKSTFLKTVAVAQLLSRSVGIVPASNYESSDYRIYTSMALRDDLMGGKSYFVVEIEALRRILEAADENIAQPSVPIMCFVDEVLRGTNTVERIASSTQILQSLSEKGVFVFAATHDIELTELLGGHFSNYHFEETIQGDDVLFNYRLQEGKATSRNAIRLLSVMGFEEEVTEKARDRARHFEQTGRWE